MMKLFIIIIIIICVSITSNIFSLPVETASLHDFLYGRTDETAYDNFYSRIVEGLAREGYNQYAPWDRQTNGFGNYLTASGEQLEQWGEVISHFLGQEFEEAQDLINLYEFPYEIIQFNDTDTGRTYYMLRELLSMEYFDDNGFPGQPEMHQHGSFDYGWGVYLFNPDSEVPVIINTPHPKDDFITVPISSLAFQEWNARFLMIAGAGREARWWGSGSNYVNSRSLSDPTRNEEHPFNTAYRAFCDDIRDNFERRELSVQIHSFDYTHEDYSSLQIALGDWEADYPTLPVRDLSESNLDIINSSPYVIHPANSIGVHDEVLVTDYYAVLYGTHGLYYYHDEMGPLPISGRINLPGIGGPQYEYTYDTDDWNQFDVFSPFFHIEMEELPSMYPQTRYYYEWFYGYDFVAQRWDVENLFTNAVKYYRPWVEAMASALTALVEFDDGTPPTAPSRLRITNDTGTRVTLEWDRSYDYDFLTYQIIYADEPLNFDEPNYVTICRADYSILASQACREVTVNNLDPGREYYFAIRAIDYNDNYSNFSEVAARVIASADISGLNATGRDGLVEITWTADTQQANRGFNVWRSVAGENDYARIASWEDNENLAGNDVENYPYGHEDDSAINGEIYNYRISCVDTENEETFLTPTASASPQPIYSLYFTNQDSTIVDSLQFGVNPFAPDAYNAQFDITKGSRPNSDYIYGMTYYRIWGFFFRSLQRDIKRYYNPEEEYKSWPVRVSSDQLDEPLFISVSENYFRNREILYIECDATGETTDLSQNNKEFQVTDTNYRTFRLYWGNVRPSISINEKDDTFLIADETINFSWSLGGSVHEIESIQLYIANADDSLFVASYDETPYPDSLQWRVPEDVFISNASFHINAVLECELVIRAKSDYLLSIVDPGLVLDLETGHHLAANPFLGVDECPAVIFGEDARIYLFDEHISEFSQIDDFLFGTGYWVSLQQPVNSIIDGQFRNTGLEMPLSKGWNLIPNVFCMPLYVKDLQFFIEPDTTRRAKTKEMNNSPLTTYHSQLYRGGGYPEYRQTAGFEDTNLTFEEAVRFGVLEYSVFNLNDNKYRLTDTVDKGQSFFLYSNIDDLNISFLPFSEGVYHKSFESEWQISIKASQSERLKDEIIIGTAAGCTEGYNRHYDLPKPPASPDGGLYFYLTSYCDTHPFPKMHIRHKPSLDGHKDSRRWDFVLEADEWEDTPVVFTKSAGTLPDNHKLELIIDNEVFLLSGTEDVIYSPQSDVVQGLIKITMKKTTSVEDENQTALPRIIANYPNPFSPKASGSRSSGTSISFYVDNPRKTKLEIFNIKGQRVVTLIDDEMEKGKHLVHWDGKNAHDREVAAGIYFSRLIMDSKIIGHRKMLLVK